ncbi:proline dehydrogenase family protein [Nitrospiraceae bacterium AH_259_D15_M11_P09]|nr:proline dehydrogenase family protein [Nitrospiraceae bacterium AH_259_D15_M11_P09]
MKTTDTTLESAIQEIGQELAQRSAGLSPTMFDARWWSNSLLDWCMKDEAFKVQLFRFIDVLPSLRNDAQISKLVEEYFGGISSLPSTFQWGLRAISATRLGSHLSSKSLRHQIEQMAHTFIAGASVEDALPVLSRLWANGRGFSVTLLGEATVSEVEADRYRDRWLEALQRLGRVADSWPPVARLEQDHFGPLPKIHVSVKLSALYSQIDPIDPEDTYRAVAARLRPLLDLAQALPVAITFDMEQAELKDLILMIFMRLLSEDAYRSYPHGGIAIQAYMKDCSKDLARLIRWVRSRGTPVTIRLVKGAYWDSDTVRYQQRGWPVPVYERKAETDANFERLTKTLIEHADLLRPAFGTHNLRSLAHAEAVAQAAGLSPHAYEYQMIFGMSEPLQAAVTQFGRRVRIYTPVGELIPGMAYLVRRLLENTSNESFLRKEYVESEALDILLAPPPVTKPEPEHDQTISSRERRLADPFVNDPHRDFSHSANREAMVRAITAVKGQLGRMFTYPVPAGLSPSGPELISHNPSLPGQVVGRVRCMAPTDVDRIAQAAMAKCEQWQSTPPAHRAEILARTAGIMRSRRDELAAWEIFETGKPWREADADVAEAIDFLDFYAREMVRLGTPKRLGREPGELNHLMLVPRGLAAVVAPWNFPLAIPTGMVSAALVTGNTVLFKPSERSPVMGSLLVEMLSEAGVPEGVLYFLPGGPEVGHALVSHRGVDLVAFTGSQAVGLQIIGQAGPVELHKRSVTRVVAEMGGKNAIIIDETADLDEAVTGVVASFTGYQGQKCSACSRAIVHEAVYDLFLQRLGEAVMSLNIGPPEDPSNRMGPMIDARAYEKVREYIDIGKREGRLLVERQGPAEGYFVGPAVFADILPTHRLAQEEIFGPVLAVMRARDHEEAIRLANSTPYALTGGVYSRSPHNIAIARERFEVGNLYINRTITGSLVGRQPFGGYRLSGVGAKAGGEDYVSQFMVSRVVSENTLRRGFAPSE